MERTVIFADRVLVYQHEIKAVKNINIRIRPNLTVYVSSNAAVNLRDVESVLLEKQKYICAALDRYAEMQKYAFREREYVNGESFRLLGHDLRLKVSIGNVNKVDNDGLFLVMTVKEDEERLKRRLIDKWYAQRCECEIKTVCAEVYKMFEKYGVEFPTIKFRNMVSRWGSCQPKRKILTFNRRLIEMPKICIEYVVLHEFVHFLQADHSKRFYDIMTMFMPDWKDRSKLLEKEGVIGIEC